MMCYDDVIYILKSVANVKTNVELAEILEINHRNFNTWKTRGEIPQGRLYEFAAKLGVSVDEITGQSVKLVDTKELTKGIDATSLPSLPAQTYSIHKVTAYKASAGGGNEINEIEVYETGEVMHIDKAFFKTPPGKRVRGMQVDGYSMIPMLLPDSWVLFDESEEFKGDGLYVINYAGQLMVKLLQLTPKAVLKVISKNPDYESYEIKLGENCEHFRLIGRVLKSIV